MPRWLLRLLLLLLRVRGVPIGGSVGWLGTWIPYSGQPVPGLCIQADAVNPAAEVVVTPGQLRLWNLAG